jgi:hypothetical protein
MIVEMEERVYRLEKLLQERLEKVVEVLLGLERDLVEMGFDRSVLAGVFSCGGRLVIISKEDGDHGMSTDPSVFGLCMRVFPFFG